MKQFYGYVVRLHEKRKFLQQVLLEIMSIAVALYFVMMFFSKIAENNQHLRYFNSHINTEHVVISVPHQESRCVSALHTVVKTSQEYLNLGQSFYLVPVVEVDQHYPQFYPLTGLTEETWQTFLTETNQMILASDLARELHKTIGEKVELRGETYTILALTSDPWRKHDLLITSHGTVSSMSTWRQKTTITLPYRELSSLDHVLSTYPQIMLSDLFQQEMASLKSFSVFLTIFSLVFIMISSINIFLIFKNSLQKEKQSRQIKWLYGETKSCFMTRVCLEYTTTAVVAFHVSILCHYLLLPLVPNFFYFELTKHVYVSELVFVVGVSSCFALILSAKQVFVKYDNVWRE